MKAELNKTTSLTFQLADELYVRLGEYLESPVAVARSKRAIVSMAIEEFLDREEPLARELFAVRESLRQGKQQA